ncbi:TRAP transporter small permease [Acuticoccus sp. MNP-M23]|uniref:TRAP transporter small permease n=1 Tax=Acuticoccus sp. MNP-M23 TaxID=3072793 RepID=UPI002814CE3C|nr:TRAP transporter small permease [Acuticoccus sp. MNP-M23]WMS43497.1 TRAP transporter small permease [Acuticoccus sp. MNP-M23]
MTDTSAPAKQGRPALDLFMPLRIAITLGLIVVVILTLAQIFFRFVLDSPLIWSEELARLLIVWITFIGAAVACWDGRHLNIDVGFGALPLVARSVVRLINAALSVGFCILLISPTLRLVKIENFSEMGALELPSGIVRLPVAVGAVFMALAIVLRLVYRRRRTARTRENFLKDAM